MSHFPVVLLYKTVEENNKKAYLVKCLDGIQWEALAAHFNCVDREQIMREHASKKLEDIIGPALDYASEKDRHLLSQSNICGVFSNNWDRKQKKLIGNH